jgi:hypothetical protein
MSPMRLPRWLQKITVVLLSALLVPAVVLGGRWLLAHPVPGEALQPVLMVVGLAAVVLGVRKTRK